MTSKYQTCDQNAWQINLNINKHMCHTVKRQASIPQLSCGAVDAVHNNSRAWPKPSISHRWWITIGKQVVFNVVHQMTLHFGHPSYSNFNQFLHFRQHTIVSWQASCRHLWKQSMEIFTVMHVILTVIYRSKCLTKQMSSVTKEWQWQLQLWQ